MEDGRKMKIQIIIDTHVADENGLHRAKVWEGEMEIHNDREYITLISIMADGQPQPICQVPFAIGIGHYQWIAPDPVIQDEESWIEE